MWLVITLIATIVVSAAYLLLKDYRKKLRLGLLNLMVLGIFLMVLVDRTIAFINGEPIIEFTTEGLIQSGTVMGFAMIAPVLVIWIIAISISHIRKPRLSFPEKI